MSSSGAGRAGNIWVGGYTDDMGGSAEGIGLIRRGDDGALEYIGLAAGIDSPSALRRNGDVIYSVGEGSNTVSAFRIRDRELLFLGSQNTAGGSPCSLEVAGNFLVVACYGDGVIDVHPFAPNGSLLRTSQSLDDSGRGPHEAQERPHAHAALLVDASTVLTADLGTDRVHIHRLGPDGLARVGAAQLPPGSGPRDLVVHPSGHILVLAELTNEVFALRKDGDGYAIAGSTALPGAERGDHAAGLVLSADGRFAYSGLRGSDLVAVISVSEDGATLQPVTSVYCGGGWPRHLVSDGDALYVANQLSNSVSTFLLGSDGVPALQGSIAVPSPTYLLPHAG